MTLSLSRKESFKGLDQAVERLKRTVKKQTPPQVSEDDENPTDEAMEKAILRLFLICIGIGVVVGFAFVVSVVMLTPHV